MYKLSADQGNAVGQWRYGSCLEKGIGVEEDGHEAARYYKLSADQEVRRDNDIMGFAWLTKVNPDQWRRTTKLEHNGCRIA